MIKKLFCVLFVTASSYTFSDSYNYFGVGTAKIDELDGPMIDFGTGEAGGIISHGRGYFMSEDGVNINIYTVGLGKSWAGDEADFSLEGGYAHGYVWAGLCYSGYCASASEDVGGYYVEAAVRGGDSTGFSYKFSVGQMDLEGSGTIFTADLNYNFSEDWGATLGFVSLDGDNGPNFSIRYNW